MDASTRDGFTIITPRAAVRRLCTTLLCVAGWAALLSGCVAFDGYPQRATAPDADLKELQTRIDAAAVGGCLDAPTDSCRNKIIAARMHATDIRFSQFEEALFRDTRKGGFGATLATLGLTSAAAFSSGGAAQILSGTAAFIIGGREAFQKEVLAERTVIAIHTAMRARRAQVALRLRDGLALPSGRYPLALALSDLNEYYNAGTVLGALIGITETVGATAQKAEDALQTKLRFQLDAPAERLSVLVCGAVTQCSSLNTSMAARARACWPEAGVPSDTLMTDFILQPKFAKQREAVATCLGI
jgi:hypothetical protein